MYFFFTSTRSDYIVKLRKFLRLSPKNFTEKFFSDGEPVKGRRSYSDELIRELEDAANEKSARCERTDTTMGERVALAMAYNDDIPTPTVLAQKVGVSRELARRWVSQLQEITPGRIPQLAKILDVPKKWLLEGGEDTLPANSILGLRVGEENLQAREDLFALTQEKYAEGRASENEETANEPYMIAYLESCVNSDPQMKKLARRCGGRWHYIMGNPVFAPWIPTVSRDSWRMDWSDEVEQIIDEELQEAPTVYAAWERMRDRCEEKGYGPRQYPKKVTLHRRVGQEAKRLRDYGVDINELVKQVRPYYKK